MWDTSDGSVAKRVESRKGGVTHNPQGSEQHATVGGRSHKKAGTVLDPTTILTNKPQNRSENNFKYTGKRRLKNKNAQGFP